MPLPRVRIKSVVPIDDDDDDDSQEKFPIVELSFLILSLPKETADRPFHSFKSGKGTRALALFARQPEPHRRWQKKVVPSDSKLVVIGSHLTDSLVYNGS
ncbi:hypothetical protein MCOR25_010162 [Pyricularia grisea]|nr:hypothetical protein MCOR25_010162 [Pyricularia grisea]